MAKLYEQVCDYRNLELAFRKARKGKTKKHYVIEFEASLEENLLLLRYELENHTYKPLPMSSFTLRDPKTRTISRSDFRDRVVHHALCNIIEPIFDKTFIFDSFANRKGKGTLKAIERFECFARKVSKNFSRSCFVLKADVRRYFDTVVHEVLLRIIVKKIGAERVVWLCKRILDNFYKLPGKGMPLGNLTSQFFANVYLNELDQFVKHNLKVKFYVRYVDDFVMVGSSIGELEKIWRRIENCLGTHLLLDLHPDKCSIKNFSRGVDFLGLRVFPKFRLLRKKNLRKFKRNWELQGRSYSNNLLSDDDWYDAVQGWQAYAKCANTYELRMELLDEFNKKRRAISTTELNRYLKLEK